MGLLFDGSGDLVNHGDVTNAEGAALTVSFWIFPIATATNDQIFDKFNSAANGWQILYSSVTGNLRFQIGNGGNPLGEDVFAPADGSWKHVLFTYDGTGSGNIDRLRGYLNGEQQTLSFTGTIPASITGNANDLIVGNSGAGSPNVVIAHVMIWNRVFTPQEAAKQMYSYRPVHTPTILWSPYHDGTATDYSGAGFHGTITNAVAGGSPPVSYGGEDLAVA